MNVETQNDRSTDPSDRSPARAGLTLFQLEICYALARDGPDYGLGLKRTLEEIYGEPINHGRLYPNLDDLEERGLLEREPLDKRTNEYRLTETGWGVVASDAYRRVTALDPDVDPTDIVPVEAATDGGESA